MRDQSKFLEEICIFVFSYDINDQVNDIERKNGGHCGLLDVELISNLKYKAAFTGAERLVIEWEGLCHGTSGLHSLSYTAGGWFGARACSGPGTRYLDVS